MLENLLGQICHRLPARTVAVAGLLLPACARCTGFYLGFLVAAAASVVRRGMASAGFGANGPTRVGALVALAYFAVDTVLAAKAPYLSLPNRPRLIASLAAGAASWVLYHDIVGRWRWSRKLEGYTINEGLLTAAGLALAGGATYAPWPSAAVVLGWATLWGAGVFYALLSYAPWAAVLRDKELGRGWRAALGLTFATLSYVEIRWGWRAIAAAATFLTRRP